MADDFGNSPSTEPGLIEVESSVLGEIEEIGDLDWFAAELVAGSTYAIDLQGAPTGQGTLTDPLFDGIYDADGVFLEGTTDDDSGDGLNSRLLFSPNLSGTYYLSAGAFGANIGSYQLTLDQVGWGYAVEALLPSVQEGNTGSTTILFDIHRSGDVHLPSTIQWEVFTENMDTLDFAGGFFPFGQVEFDAGQITATVFVDIQGDDDPESDESFFLDLYSDGAFIAYDEVTVLNDDSPDDYSQDINTSGQIVPASSVTGEIEIAYDQDWFAVELVAGTDYQIDLEGSATEQGTLPDTYIRGIYSADGVWLEDSANDDGGEGLNSRLFYSPTVSATFFIAAGGYGDSTGTYRLSVEEVAREPQWNYSVSALDARKEEGDDGVTEFSFEVVREGDLSLPSSVDWQLDPFGDPQADDFVGGELPSGRVDFLEGESSQTLTLQIQGDTLPEGDETLYVTLIAGDETIAYDWGVILNDDLAAEDDYGEDAQTAGVVFPGTPVIGAIEQSGDNDWFAIELALDRDYLINLEGAPTAMGTLNDTYIRGIYDSVGNLLPGSTDDDGGTDTNSQLSFTSEVQGTYYIAAGAFGTHTGTYQLSVEDITQADWQYSLAPLNASQLEGNETGAQLSFEILRTGDTELASSFQWEVFAGEGIDGSDFVGGRLPFGEFEFAPDQTNATLFIEVQGDITPEQDEFFYLDLYVDGELVTWSEGAILNDDDLDDYTQDINTLGSLLIGESVTGTIESSGDEDWFAASLEAGHNYLIDLEGTPTAAGTLTDPFFRGLYDASGNLVPGTDNDDGGIDTNSQVFFTPETTAVYFLSAGAFGDTVGTYNLSLDDVTPPDVEFTIEALDPSVLEGNTGSTSMNFQVVRSGDLDQESVLRWEVYNGLDVDGDDFIGGVLPSGSLIFASGESSRNITLDIKGDLQSEGDENLWLDLYSGDLLLTWAEATILNDDASIEDDFGADVSTLGQLLPGSEVTGTIETAGDRDWFAIELQSGQTYTIDLQGFQIDNGALSDTYLDGIYDTSGNFIDFTSDDDSGEGLYSQLRFQPDTTATYYIAAAAFGSETGGYRLSVTDPVSNDDFGSDINTLGELLVGDSAGGEIEQVGDQDWFAVVLNADTSYQIDLEGNATMAGTLADPFLTGVFDSNGEALVGTSDDDGGESFNSQIELSVATTGLYFVAASGYGDNTGSYRLSVNALGGDDDFTDDASTEGTLTIAESVSGLIEKAGDQDWFAVTLTAGQTYQIDLEGSPSGRGTLNDTYLRGIYDASSSLLANSEDDDGGTDTNSRLFFTAVNSGIHYIATGGYGESVGSYQLSLNLFALEDDFASDADTRGQLNIDSSVTGTIEREGDEDWFSVQLQQGNRYQIDLEGLPTGAGDLSDPFLAGIYAETGLFIEATSNDDSGVDLNSQLIFSPRESGTHFVAAAAFGDDRGSYKLSLTDLGAIASDDFGDSIDNTGAVVIGEATNGELESAGDIDWFAVELESGRHYQISLEGAATDKGDLDDPFLTGLYDATGALIDGTSDDDSGFGRNSYLDFSPGETGVFYIAASGYAGATGGYEVSVLDATEPVIEDDFGNEAATAGSVTVNGSSSGVIEGFGDRDWFAVELQAGITYRFNLNGTNSDGGTLTDPFLSGIYQTTLLDATSDDDSGVGFDSQLLFTPDASGTYYIEASGKENSLGTYTLSVSEVQSSNPGDFDIVVNFSGDASYLPLFEAAAQRWEEIIVGNLPGVQTESWGFVDDLLIDASVTSIDGPGGILAQAGADWIRSSSFLPIHGIMSFDSADVFAMEAKGILQDVIIHEMGHVLGFSGWFFDQLGLAQGFNFTGTNAATAYGQLINNTTATSVPLETQGGAGTARSHWPENLFDTELMTGYAENSPPMPLSIITVGAFEDLGYEVDYSSADDFTFINPELVIQDNGDQQAEEPGPGSVLSSVLGEAEAESGFHYFNQKPLYLLPLAANTDDGSATAALSEGNGVDGPLDLSFVAATPQAVPSKLSGSVLSADENAISFLDDETGLRIQLEGAFAKDEPETSEDIKGNVDSVTFVEGYSPVSQMAYSESRGVEEVLDNWQGDFLEGDNAIQITSTNVIADIVDAGAGNDFLSLGFGDDSLIGGEGDDQLFGESGNDEIYGEEGDDQLSGGLGNDIIDGGEGNDILLADYLPSQYVYADGILDGDEDRDTITSIESVGFGYGMGNDVFQVEVALEDLQDPDGAGALKSNAATQLDALSDLYIAYFGRAPQATGLTYWFGQIYSGALTFYEAAQSFSVQEEYQNTYPQGTSNLEFIESIYQNMFNRSPAEGGLIYWQEQLDAGMPRDVFILAVINGAYAPTGGENDRAILINKHEVSVYYAERTMLYPEEGFDQNVNTLISAVTSDSATADTAKEIIDYVFTNDITLTGVVEDQALWDSFWEA
jgi:hypothetical protein